LSRAALRSTLALTGVGGLFATALLNAAVAGAAEACVTGEDGATTVCTLVDTGAEQAFVVPEGVRALEVTIPGGEQPAPAQLAIAPGSTLLVDLGGAGEFRLPPEPAEEGAAEDVPVPQWVIDSDTGVSALLRVAPEVEDPAPVGEAAEILADDAAVLPSDGVVAAGSVEDEAADPVELPPASIVIRYSVPQPAATPAPTAPAQAPVDDSSEVPAVEVQAVEVPAVEAAPAEMTPAEPTPVEASPAEASRAEPTPVEATPAETTPAEVVPAPAEAPVEVPLVEPTPTEPTPTEPTAGPAEAPVEVAPVEVAPAPVEPVEAPVTTAPVVRGTAEPTDVPTPTSNPARPAETPAPAAEAPVALDLQAASSTLPDDLLDTNGVGMLAAALAGVVTVGVVVLLAGGARRRD
jgi:hypothetical protein